MDPPPSPEQHIRQPKFLKQLAANFLVEKFKKNNRKTFIDCITAFIFNLCINNGHEGDARGFFYSHIKPFDKRYFEIPCWTCAECNLRICQEEKKIPDLFKVYFFENVLCQYFNDLPLCLVRFIEELFYKDWLLDYELHWDIYRRLQY